MKVKFSWKGKIHIAVTWRLKTSSEQREDRDPENETRNMDSETKIVNGAQRQI